MPGGEVGIAYTSTLTASGGGTPYSWSADGGNLPPGLTLGADGSVTGVPGAAGTFSFTVKATDSQNQYTTQGATIKIAPHLAASLIPACAQACYVEQGCVNVCGAFGQQSGGVAPFKYSASGNIPSGETLNGLSLAGSFPSLAQFWQFNVTITDALGATASVSPTFYVYRHISVASGSCIGNFLTGCFAQLKITGGNPNGQVSVRLLVNGPPGPKQGCGAPGPPPPGSLTAGSGVVTVSIPKGIGANAGGYGAIWTIAVSDQSVCGNGINCTSPNATVVVEVPCG